MQPPLGRALGEQVPAPAAVDAVPPVAREADAKGALTLEIADDLAGIDRFEEFHRAHHGHPESHFDLLRAAFHHGRTAKPFFAQVLRDGRPCTLMVGQLADGRLRWRLGYRTVHASRARSIEVLQGGWLGDVSRPCLEFLCEHLYGFLRRGGADAIHLRHVPAHSEVREVFARHPSWIWRDRSPAWSTNWQLRVPASFSQWMRQQPKREREDNKRYDRRIAKDFGERVRVDLFDRVADVDHAAQVVESIARKTYQRGMAAGFHDGTETRARWAAAAVRDSLDVRVLWLGDQPAAFCIGFTIDGTLWLEHLGYDPAFRRYRPGMFLLQRAIENLSARGDVHTVDFGIGDADYKRRLCTQSRTNVSIYLFAPTLRGFWLNSLRGLANGAGRAGAACLDRLGLLPWFKSRWRRALQPKDTGDD